MGTEKFAASIAGRHVLVNDELEILQFRGDVSLYLTPLPGRAGLAGGPNKELVIHARQVIGGSRAYPLILVSVRRPA